MMWQGIVQQLSYNILNLPMIEKVVTKNRKLVITLLKLEKCSWLKWLTPDLGNQNVNFLTHVFEGCLLIGIH